MKLIDEGGSIPPGITDTEIDRYVYTQASTDAHMHIYICAYACVYVHIGMCI